MGKKIYKKCKSLPIYFGYLEIIVAKSLANAVKQCPEYGITQEEDWDTFGGFAMCRRKKSGSKVYGIFLGPKCSVRGISHEANHIKNYIFKEIGYRPDLDNDEAESYLMGYITGEISDFYNKHKKKINKK